MARLVPLTVCYSIPEALCLRTMLAAYGITSVATAFHHPHMDWYYLRALGGISICVVETCADDARVLAVPVEDYVDDLQTEAEAFMRRPFFNFAIAAPLLLIGGIFIPFWIRHRRFKSEESA